VAKLKTKYIKKLPHRQRSGKIRVLGLDCSSSTIGWGLVTFNKEPVLLSHGYIKPLSSKYELFERLDDVFTSIQELCEELKPSHVVIEDIVLHMRGRSSAKTITTLAIFNRVAGLAARKYCGESPGLFAVGTIRKYIRHLNRDIDPKFKKEDIPELIRCYLKPNVFEDLYNRNNKIRDETYDQADGIAAAWAYSIYLGKKDE
jgi:hypothetical protein